jgi:hypothetical protein
MLLQNYLLNDILMLNNTQNLSLFQVIQKEY